MKNKRIYIDSWSETQKKVENKSQKKMRTKKKCWSDDDYKQKFEWAFLLRNPFRDFRWCYTLGGLVAERRRWNASRAFLKINSTEKALRESGEAARRMFTVAEEFIATTKTYQEEKHRVTREICQLLNPRRSHCVKVRSCALLLHLHLDKIFWSLIPSTKARTISCHATQKLNLH